MSSNNFRLTAIILGLLALVLMVSCQTTGTDAPTTAPEETSEPLPTTGEANVDSIELLIMESFPVQINAIAQGKLPDSCTQIDEINQTRDENKFNVTISVLRDASEPCDEAEVDFEEIVSLDVNGLPAGSYIVDVNGITQAFAFDVDNVAFEPDPTAEPTVEQVAEATPEPTVEAAGTGSISGLVWHDLCAITEEEGEAATPGEGCVVTPDFYAANGILDDGEPPLEGVVVSVSAGACPGTGSVRNATTGEDGAFLFENLSAGDYCVYVNELEEPNTALLIPGQWTAPADAAKAGRAAVTVADGETVADINLGWDFQYLPEAAAVACIDLVLFDGDITVPDDSAFEAGEKFVKTWRVVNIGGCAWSKEYELAFVGGDAMGAPAAVPLEHAVESGEWINISVPFTAPTAPGVYRSEWQLRDASGELMGMGGDPDEALWVQIETFEAGALGAISGFVWEDLCDDSLYTFGDETLPPGCVVNPNGTIRGDSIFGDGEVVMPDVNITLGVGECGSAETLSYTTTDEEGKYSFDNLRPGTYCVYIDVLEAENYNLLIPGDFTFPGPSRAGTTVTIAASDEVGNINFAWDYTNATTEEE